MVDRPKSLLKSAAANPKLLLAASNGLTYRTTHKAEKLQGNENLYSLIDSTDDCCHYKCYGIMRSPPPPLSCVLATILVRSRGMQRNCP